MLTRQAIAELRAKLGEDAISTDDDDLQRHGYSEWSTVNADRLPVAIAYPKSTEEVAEIAKVCHRYRMPMVPYSGGSSLEANFAAPYGGMTIDFAHMDRILAVHADDMDVVVQPAVQWMDLNEQLKPTGLFFPVDPGPSARIGGMVGTNCSGTNAVRYGTMKDWVINLTVVLADGRVVKTRRRPRKTSAGYNLTSLFVGSEGTLGIVTEITLKLATIPEETRVGVVTFPTIRDAASAAMQVIRRGVPVQSMEILDDVQMSVINRAGGTGRVWTETPTLFFKFSGTAAQVADSIRLASELARQNRAESFEFARDEHEADVLWSARKQSLWSMLALRDESSPDVWSTDVAVPISRLPDIIGMCPSPSLNVHLSRLTPGRNLQERNGRPRHLRQHPGPHRRRQLPREHHVQPARPGAARPRREMRPRHGRPRPGYGGFLHGSPPPLPASLFILILPTPFAVRHKETQLTRMCLQGEHGIGIGKKDSLLKELGPDTIDVMRSLKRALDPHWLLNPGKIFDYSRDSKSEKLISEAVDLDAARLVGA